MYYSSGNYEAFARPAKPEGIEDKSAYIVGTGLAGLSAACYLIRDAQMDGSRVHLFERDAEPGGACDGWEYPQLGFTMRGGREMDNHFEVMWDLFRSIPSIEDENMSILDYYYQLNKRDPNYSLCRATVNRGEDAGLDNTFNLSDKACMEIMNLFFTPEEQLDDKPITDYFFRRCARFQLLAVLAHHVRLRELAQRARDEALHPAFRPPRRRAPRLQRTALHPVQPVRIPHPAHGELPERPGRADPSEHRGRRHHVLQHPGAQSSHRGADDMRRGRPAVHHQRQLRRQFVLRIARRAGPVQRRAGKRNRVRPVATYRTAGFCIRESGKIHRRSGEVQLDERHRHDAR